MHFDPLAPIPDIDKEANSRAVPLTGRPLMRLLFGDWRTGAVGESEYFQAWVLVWCAVGPFVIAGIFLFLPGLVDPSHPMSQAAIGLLAATLIVVTANLSAKRARGKGLPGWVGPATSLIGWVLLPLLKGAALLLVVAGPALAGAVVDRLGKKVPPKQH